MPIHKELYPENWNQIRKEIFERDNYRCIYCGRKNGYFILVNDVWLPVSDSCIEHYRKTNVRTFKMSLSCIHLNHDPSDCRSENLATACVWDHLSYDKNHQVSSKKYGTKHRINQFLLFDEEK